MTTVITAGPFGAFAAILLLRNREQQREVAATLAAKDAAHAANLKTAWTAVDGLREELKLQGREQAERDRELVRNLERIVTILDRRER